MTLLSKLLSFKYVAPSQQASAWTREGGGGGGQRSVADTCLSQDEPGFVTRASGLAVGTGPRQI